MGVKSFLSLMLLAVACGASAQQSPDTVLKGSTIEVIQAYKPQIKEAAKPEWIPQLLPPDTTHPSFNYEVPQQTLYYSYSSLPLRPLALGKEKFKLPFPNYVKLGYGNLSTLFVDAGVGGLHGKDYETNVHLHHLSQKGSITDQQSAQSGMEAEGVFHTGNADWRAGLVAERNQYNFYGGDHALAFVPDSIKQVFTTIRAFADVQNKQDSTIKLNYHPAINAGLYRARLDASEISFGINAPVSYRVSPNLDALATLVGAVASYSAGSVNTGNNYVALLPGISYREKQFSGHALFGFGLGKGSAGYFLPDILAAYTIRDTRFVVSAGLQALLRQNTYEQLTTENPYLYSYNTILQTKSTEFFANIQGATGDHLAYSGRISLWQFRALPTFLNDFGNMRQFYINYTNVNAISFKAAARYQVANTWSVGAAGDYYGFYGGTDAHVWQQPNLKIKGDFVAVPLRKLTVTAYLALIGGMYAKDINHNVVNMKMIADIGGNAEYLLIPRLSAFAQVNNLFGTRYQRWYGYQAYRINIYGGIRFKF